ncbi:hypothetical protein KIH74_13215 [Kineosporia sp. J2-2]|uniref:IclR-ED domain-containing protein n=1 Tax=Kineosporia corallincola TaxID=2835133 RepID=A0ABS5TFM3_9ACTN|nr:IclR family transcriptional regulator C-terminal domain-containing protein [Kineosporia corallincola]MBT0769890.1 hypothetical protein [Kineosporia corallincola]
MPVPVGTLARDLGTSLSQTSRLGAELHGLGLLEPGEAYGTYRLGPEAVRLSGRAAAPYARAVRYALTLAAHQTGETACLAARCGSALLITAMVESLWTLHAPADPGDVVDEQHSAMARADRSHRPLPEDPEQIDTFESTIGRCTEIAAPVLGPQGENVAVLAVRLPVNRLAQNGFSAHRAVQTARRSIENAIAQHLSARRPLTEAPVRETVPTAPTALLASLFILQHLAAGPDSLSGTARAVGLRTDRAQRLVDSCVRAGLVTTDNKRTRYRLSWAVHAWHRRATVPALERLGSPLAALTAERTRTCVFLTVLHGMRSFTLVEHLSSPGAGLRMSPWRGRAHPIIGSDGGPVLVMDLELPEIAELFPPRYSRLERDRFLRRVRQVVQEGAISMEPFDDTGMQSVAAPVRDSSGAVAAAACLVGTTEYFATDGARLEAAVRQLADQLSQLLQYPSAPGSGQDVPRPLRECRREQEP